MALDLKNVTVKIPVETYEKKQKALYILSEKNSNLSRELTKIIEENAKEFDSRLKSGD